MHGSSRSWVRPEVHIGRRPSTVGGREVTSHRTLAIALSWRRPENLPDVITGLRRQSYIDDIMVFHNHPSNRRIEGCVNIVSDHNFGCAVRHQLAPLLDYDTFVFIDDDLMLTEDLAPRLLPVIEAHGQRSVIGIYGQMLDCRHQRAAYSRGRPVTADDVRPVDLVKGRFHILSRCTLQAISGPGLNTPALLAEDDIRMNVAVQLVFNEPGYLIPAIGVKELPAPHARWRRAHHSTDRDRAVFDGLQLGWKPLGPLDDSVAAD